MPILFKTELKINLIDKKNSKKKNQCDMYGPELKEREL